jgi:hypothetical protein
MVSNSDPFLSKNIGKYYSEFFLGSNEAIQEEIPFNAFCIP